MGHGYKDLQSNPNADKLEMALAHGQREADHGYNTGDLCANIKGFVWLVFSIQL